MVSFTISKAEPIIVITLAPEHASGTPVLCVTLPIIVLAAKSFIDSGKQAKAAKNAASNAAAQNAAAIQSIKDSQNAASTNAKNQIDARSRARSGAQSIFTSPLGITTQANTAKKTLLGE